jgi:hypothetical protein
MAAQNLMLDWVDEIVEIHIRDAPRRSFGEPESRGRPNATPRPILATSDAFLRRHAPSRAVVSRDVV